MFSIIICTYNGERTIKRTIEKILKQQEYDNYVEQLIVVDNASVDSTKDIALRYKKKSQLSYAYEEKNGLSFARRKGVEIATAEWTVFVDDDNELDSNWIANAAEFIRTNTDVAIFGGSVIPKLEFKPTKSELDRLAKHYGMLACTDLRREDIDFSLNKSPFGGIIGAGMVVKTEYLKELLQHGWIKQVGRTKNNTAAGDDGEISRFVTECKKKKAGYCPYMIIEHNLPQFRLSEEYLLKLQKSLAEGSYNGQSLKRYYVLRRLKSFAKLNFKKNPYPVGTFEYKMEQISRDVYLELLYKDKLILRKAFSKNQL